MDIDEQLTSETGKAVLAMKNLNAMYDKTDSGRATKYGDWTPTSRFQPNITCGLLETFPGLPNKAIARARRPVQGREA